MADTYFFLKLDGIDGESQDTDHSGEIDVMSFSEGITNAGTFDAGTGGNTGQANYADLSIAKYVDKSSTTLRQYCGLGTAIDTLVGDIREFDTVNWREVVPQVTSSSEEVRSSFESLLRALSVPTP